MAIYTGRGAFELSLCDMYQPAGVAVSSASNVLFPFGSPNTMGAGALCYVSFAIIAPHLTMGRMLAALKHLDAQDLLFDDEAPLVEPSGTSIEPSGTSVEPSDASATANLNWDDDPDLLGTLHLPEAPDLPQRLGPGQAAQLSELLEYLHIRLRHLTGSVRIKGDSERVTLEARQWQNLLDLRSRLAEYLRSIGEPDEER